MLFNNARLYPVAASASGIGLRHHKTEMLLHGRKISVVMHQDVMSLDAVVLSATRVLAIDGRALTGALKAHSHALLGVVRLLGERLARTKARMANSLVPAEPRLALPCWPGGARSEARPGRVADRSWPLPKRPGRPDRHGAQKHQQAAIRLA
jgi:CRP-like cAMP-binding protein